MLSPDLASKLSECANHNFVGTRDMWFGVVSDAAIGVILGLIAEAPELIHDLIPICLKIKAKLKNLPSEIPKREAPAWVKVIAFLGWIFIVSGLGVEQFAGTKVQNLDANIQECSDAKVQAATLDAGDAATSAQRAHDEADAAGIAAEDAKKKVKAVGKEADDLMTTLGTAEGKLRQLQIFALARHINDTDALVESLKPFKGRQVVLRSYIGDAEGWLFCVSLLDVVQRAQMNAIDQCGQWPFDAGKPETGLHIRGPDSSVIAEAIIFKGRTTGGAVAEDGAAPLLIFSGIKNPFWLPEQDLATSPQQKSKNKPRAIRKDGR